MGETSSTMAERYVTAVAAGDRDALAALLADDVDFRAVTPSRSWESRSAAEVVDVIIGRWFGGDRHIDAVERVEHDRVSDCERVGYRFRATDGGAQSVVEQQAYLTVEDGAIRSLRIVCSGFRAATAAAV